MIHQEVLADEAVMIFSPVFSDDIWLILEVLWSFFYSLLLNYLKTRLPLSVSAFFSFVSLVVEQYLFGFCCGIDLIHIRITY